MSNRDLSVNVYVKEETTNYLKLNSNYIINITQVNLTTYSDNRNQGSAATIILKEDNVNIFDETTKFNMLVHGDLDLTIVSSANIFYIENKSKNILLHKSAMSVQNFNIVSAYNSNKVRLAMILAFDLQEKTVVFRDIDFEISGGIFYTGDPVVVIAENLNIDLYRSQYGIIIVAAWNYPEAVLDGGLYINNVTIYDSQEKLFFLSDVVIKYSGPGHFVVDNIYINTYSTFAFVDPVLQSLHIDEWDPITDDIQYANISNSYFTLPENPDETKHLMVAVAPSFGINSRPAEGYFYNNVLENYDNALFNPLLLAGGFQVKMYSENNILRNWTSREAVFRFWGVQASSKNDIITQINSTSNIVLNMVIVPSVYVYNLTMSDIISPSFSYNMHWSIDAFFGSNVTVDTVTFKNINSGRNSLVVLYNQFFGDFTFKNIIFDNIETVGGYPLIAAGTITGCNVQNVTFKNIYKEDPDENTNVMMNFGTIDLVDSAVYLFNEITVTNSTVPLYYLNSFANANKNGSTFTMSNIHFYNCKFEFPENLIHFDNIFSESDFSITIEDSEFYNLEFVRGGNLMYLQQQIDGLVEVKNCSFSNLTSAVIRVESSVNRGLEAPSRVKLSNIMVNNIFGLYRSFIRVSQVGFVEVWDSTFTNIYNIFEGSVALVEDNYACLHFYRCMFQNNTSVRAALFTIQNAGALKWTSCTVKNNFAIEAGLIYSYSDAYFEIYDSEITENYAMSISMAQIIDSAGTSIVSNSSIYGNHVISSTDLQYEIGGVWSKLCYIGTDLKPIVLQTITDNTVKVSEFLIELIRGSLTFNGSSHIYDEKYLVNSFISSLNLKNTIVYNISSEKPLIQAASSELNLTNVSFTNITEKGKPHHFKS